ncbi:MAG: hypothetical protein ABF515_04195, partial [Bifidobacterium sp.]
VVVPKNLGITTRDLEFCDLFKVQDLYIVEMTMPLSQKFACILSDCRKTRDLKKTNPHTRPCMGIRSIVS